jgi:hypothetical protein
MTMPLKPQDLVVALKLAVIDGSWPSFSALGLDLGISGSEVHACVKRATKANILAPSRKPNRANLHEFIAHGVRFAFYVERGEVTRGMPTAHAAPPLSEEILAGDMPPVWPDPEGEVRGETFEPLYRTVPTAARNDARLYELLALVDAIRGGRARERALAVKLVKERLYR